MYVLIDFGDFVIKGKLDSQIRSFCIYISYFLGTFTFIFWEQGNMGFFFLGTWEQTPLFYGNMGT